MLVSRALVVVALWMSGAPLDAVDPGNAPYLAPESIAPPNEPDVFRDPNHPDHYDYLGNIRQKSFDHVKPFRLHNHLTQAHPWDQDGGRRLARNAIRLGKATDEHRKLLPTLTYNVSDAIFQPFDQSTKKISESYRLKIDGYMDKLPFGEGPGVMPFYKEGSRKFWTGKYDDGTDVPISDRTAESMWEIQACPVFDVETFVVAPWTCVYGESPLAGIFNFIADVADGTLINLLINNFLPVVKDFLLGEFLQKKIDGAADIVCGFFGVLDEVKKEVDKIAEIENKITAITKDVEDAIKAGLGFVEKLLSAIVKPLLDTFSDIKKTVCGLIGSIPSKVGEIKIPGINDLKEDMKDALGCSRRRRDLQEARNLVPCSGHMTPCQDLNPPNIDCSQCFEEDDCAAKCFVCIQGTPRAEGVCISLQEAKVHSELISSSKAILDSVEQMTVMLTRRMDAMDARVQEGIHVAFDGIAADNKAIAETIISSMLESEERVKDRTQDAEMFMYDTIHEQCYGRGDIPTVPESDREDVAKDGDNSNYGSLMDIIRKSEPYQQAQEAAADKGMTSADLDEILATLFGSLSDPHERSDGFKEELKGTKGMADFGDYIMDAINKNEDKILIQETSKVVKDRFLLHEGSHSERRLLDFSTIKDDCDALTNNIGEKIQNVIGDLLKEIFEDNGETPGFLQGAQTQLQDAGEEPNKIQSFMYMLIRQFDPFRADSPLLIPFRLIFKVVQEIASFFLYGCSKTFDSSCKELPSRRDRLITVSETRDGKILLSKGCTVDFSAEVAFYIQALGFIKPIVTQVKDLIPDINIGGEGGIAVIMGTGEVNIKPYLQIPFDVLEWVLEELGKTFEKLTETCDSLKTDTSSAVYENTRLALAELACRPLAEGLLKGHGCDGLDNTCDDDKQIDECAEDAFPPEIEMSRVKELCSPDKHVFPDIATAISCVEDHAMATDDCYPTQITVSEVTGSEPRPVPDACGSLWQIQVSATEEPGCGKSSLTLFDVLVDASASSYCQFPRGPETPPVLDISSAIAHCSGKIIFSGIAEALACVELHMEASDFCRDVEVEVISTGSTGIVEDCGTVTHMVEVTAAVKGCAGLSSTEPMMVLVDPLLEHPSCQFKQSLKTPPSLDITQAIAQCAETTVFSSLDEALACVELHTQASDVCRDVEVEVVSTGSTGIVEDCGTVTHRVEVTAAVKGCAGLSTTESMMVLVDPLVEHPSCQFKQSLKTPPSLDITQAIAQCTETTVFSSLDAALACVELHTKASDVCRDVEIAIVSTRSYEIVEGCGTVSHVLDVTASVKDCSGLSSTESLEVFVDPNLEHPTCKFDFGPQVDPTLDVSQAVELCNDQVFSTVGEAEDCVLGNTKAEDTAGGCRPVELDVSTQNVNGLCEHQVLVKASIKGCSTLQTGSVPINVTIDNERPIPSCSFSSPTIEKTGSGVLVNPQLSYSVTENCGTNLAVTVEGYSNEKEDFNAQEMLLVYETSPAPGGGNRKVGWYVASTCCSTNSNGQCISDPQVPKSRFYEARITATDKAGLSATTTCRLEVVDKRNGGDKSIGGEPSQFFSLMSHAHKDYVPDPLLP